MTSKVDEVNINSEDIQESNTNKDKTQISLDTIAVNLLKHNFILTALELHTELAECGRELPRLRDFFSNPVNFEQYSQNAQNSTLIASNNFPLHKTPSIQTFDSLDLTRYSDDISDNNNKVEDKITLLEFELRKARETISQLRYTLTITTENETLLISPPPTTTTTKSNSNDNFFINIDQNHVLLPHEKNAINFLINEYLLLQNYKMTSVTFSEENESQDLEDWDVVGINKSKPPNLINLYKYFNNYSNQLNHPQNNSKNEKEILKKIEFGQNVNLDENLIESQINEIENLNEKQKLLLNKIEQLQTDIDNLNNERELFIKKIDSLTSVNADLKKKINTLEEQNKVKEELEQQKQQLETSNNIIIENQYEKFKFERKIPILFQEAINKQIIMKLNDENEKILKEIYSINSNYDDLVCFVAKYLPNIITNINLQKRVDLIPLIVYSAILQQSSNERDSLLRLLFNLIKKPDEEQRAIILAGCACFAKQAGPDRANNELLPQCWEQISSKYEEIRCMVAESCAILAPYIPVDIRGSLMLSILKQIILQDKSEEVRISATKSLGVLINYIQDEEKFLQCIELLDYCLKDSYNIQFNANLIIVPSLALWSIELNKICEPFISHYLKFVEMYINNDNQKQIDKAKIHVNLLKNLLQYLYAYILINIKVDTTTNTSPQTNGKSPLMSRSYSKYSNNCSKNKKNQNVNDFSNLDLIIDKCNIDLLRTTFDYKINDLSIFNEFEIINWVENEFFKKIVNYTAQIDAHNSLTIDFIEFFKNLYETFNVDYIRLKIVPLFNEFFQDHEVIDDESALLSTDITSKSIISVYFVGILSKCYNSSNNDDVYDENDNKSNENFEYLHNFLNKLLIKYSLNELKISNLNVIFDQLSKTSKSFHLQVLLSTLWDGIVHASSNVRLYTAKLFEILVRNIDDTILSNRVLPALITLANDPDRIVRCASISPLCSVIENYTNKEILERVYTQLQSFLNDPTLKDDFTIKIELIKAFKRIITKIDIKFREEFLLPYLTILTMQTIQAQHALLSLHENKSYEITCQLFDVYNSLNSCTISRQSIQESILPGLNCLKQILHENQILYTDKLKTVDTLIIEFESKLQLQQQHNGSYNDISSNSFLTNTTTITTATIPNSTSSLETNIKSFVFKGFANSKDKFSSFLNKKH